MNIDRIFEQGVSDLSRVPQQMLTDAEIASAAAASKSGAGIWLLSHAKELLLCAVSFAVGVGTTLTATHLTGNSQETLQSPENSIVVEVDSTAMDNPEVDYEPAIAQPTAKSQQPTANGQVPTANDQLPSVNDQRQRANTQPPTDPVIVKKTITKRDTVRINETVIVKDTVYKIEN